jgi:hypothetical protein
MDATGTQARVSHQTGYEFTYIYAALAPAYGHLIVLLLADMTGASFQLFLRFFET